MDADHITLPDILHRQITLVGSQISLHSLAVHTHAISRLLGITILIKVARNHLIANPSRNAHQQIGTFHTTLLYQNLDIAIPRILSSLLQHHFLAHHLDGRSISGKEIHIDILVLHAIEITRQ